MPRRHRRLRWAQVLAFVVGVGGGTAAAAEPTEPRPPSTAPEDHAHTGRAQPGPDDPAADPTGNGATEESARTRTDWLASDGRGWTPLKLHGYQTRTLSALAPSPAARGYRIYVREVIEESY